MVAALMSLALAACLLAAPAPGRAQDKRDQDTSSSHSSEDEELRPLEWADDEPQGRDPSLWKDGEPLPPIDALDPEVAARAQAATRPSWSPTAHAGVGTALTPSNSDPARWADEVVQIWLGMSYYPNAQTYAPFISMGVELDLRSWQGSTRAVDVVPTAKFGIAWLARGTEGVFGDTLVDTLAIAKTYIIAGIVPWSRGIGPAGRLGLGFSLPALAPVIGAGYALIGGIFDNLDFTELPLVPNTIEVIVQLDVTGNTETLLAWTLGF